MWLVNNFFKISAGNYENPRKLSSVKKQKSIVF